MPRRTKSSKTFPISNDLNPIAGTAFAVSASVEEDSSEVGAGAAEVVTGSIAASFTSSGALASVDEASSSLGAVL